MDNLPVPFNAAAHKAKANGTNPGSLQWHVLGGNNNDRIGMNAGLCTYEGIDEQGQKVTRTMLFDAGTLMAEGKKPEHPVLASCDTVIPDLSFYLEKKDDPSHVPLHKIDSIFLTHNHGDHTAALPFMALLGYKLPKIYATPYTAKRLEQDLSNSGLNPDEWPEIYTIAPGKAIEEGPVNVSAFWVSHSTPQSVGFFIETPAGNVLTLGDFKLDQSVIWGPSFNESQFRRMVEEKPVDLLVLDSTGADRDMTGVTEHDVRETLRGIMEEDKDKRFVVAVMSGFEENFASVAKVASEMGRSVWACGWAHEQALDALKQTGLTLSDSIGSHVDLRMLTTPRHARDLAETSPDKSVVIVTGAQGMNSAVLTRAADDHHPFLHLDPKKDVILFCAPSVPGQEAYRERLLSTLRAKGFKVLTKNDANLYTHAHARLPELIEMAKMVKAKTILPAHGDRHLRETCGEEMKKIGQNVIQADNGDVIRVTREKCESTNPPTKGYPPLIGFKTVQGATWADRDYLMFKTPRSGALMVIPPAVNSNGKKRPKVYDVGPK